MIRVYISGASSQLDALEVIAAELACHQKIQVLDGWMRAVRTEMQAGRRDHDLSIEEQRAYAQRDLEDVATCDVFWLVVPPREVLSVGMWVELGFALALRRAQIVISGNVNRSIFCHADEHAILESDNGDAIKAIEAMAERAHIFDQKAATR